MDGTELGELTGETDARQGIDGVSARDGAGARKRRGVVVVAVVCFGIVCAGQSVVVLLSVGRVGRGKGSLRAAVGAVWVWVGHGVLVRVEVVADETLAIRVRVEQGQPVIDTEDGRVFAHADSELSQGTAVSKRTERGAPVATAAS